MGCVRVPTAAGRTSFAEAFAKARMPATPALAINREAAKVRVLLAFMAVSLGDRVK
jgi:hypothetical protein